MENNHKYPAWVCWLTTTPWGKFIGIWVWPLMLVVGPFLLDVMKRTLTPWQFAGAFSLRAIPIALAAVSAWFFTRVRGQSHEDVLLAQVKAENEQRMVQIRDEMKERETKILRDARSETKSLMQSVGFPTG